MGSALLVHVAIRLEPVVVTSSDFVDPASLAIWEVRVIDLALFRKLVFTVPDL